MPLTLQIVTNIVVLAAIYALVCAGYVLVYRVSRVLNLAHGELLMLGAYLLAATAGAMGEHPAIALIVAGILSAIVGVLVYALLMRWMTGGSVLAAILITIALGILLRGAIVLIWTGKPYYPAAMFGWSNPPVHVMPGVSVSSASLAILLVSLAVYVALVLFLRFTTWGIRLRAAGQSPILAEQRGIRLNAVYALAWGLSTFTASLAGILLALDSGVEQSMATIGLKAFPAVLVGGLDSLLGAWVGALIVAAAEVVAIQFVSPLLSDVIPFVVLLIALTIRPWGLFGSREQLDRV